VVSYSDDPDPWVLEYEQAESALVENSGNYLQPNRRASMGRFTSDVGGGKDFKQPEPGNHIARCVGIYDLGTQHGEYKGKPTRHEQIILRFELPFETDVFDGVEKPLLVGTFLTNSLGEKATMRQWLESWRAKPFNAEELAKFDLNAILGKACTLSIVHNAKGKAKVMSIAALPKGTVCPPAFNPLGVFWIEEWNDEAFDALPKFYQEMIEKSDEYKLRGKGDAFEDDIQDDGTPADEDIPF
jgi:hypothetical protein